MSTKKIKDFSVTPSTSAATGIQVLEVSMVLKDKVFGPTYTYVFGGILLNSDYDTKEQKSTFEFANEAATEWFALDISREKGEGLFSKTKYHVTTTYLKPNLDAIISEKKGLELIRSLKALANLPLKTVLQYRTAARRTLETGQVTARLRKELQSVDAKLLEELETYEPLPVTVKRTTRAAQTLKSAKSPLKGSFGALEKLGYDNYCTESLGEGAYGKTYKVCKNKDCTNCNVIKVGQVTLDEIAIIELVDDVTKNTVYANNVQRLVAYDRTVENYYLVGLQYYSNYGTFFDYSFNTKKRVDMFIVQLFMTLDFLYNKLSFVHMDLHLGNVLALRWVGDDPSTLTYTTASVPQVTLAMERPDKRTAIACLIDYGLAVLQDSNEGPGFLVYEKQCAHPVFDAYKVLTLLLVRLSNVPKLKEIKTHFLENILYPTFPEDLYKTFRKKYTDRYGGLNSVGCRLMLEKIDNGSVEFRVPADVIRNSSYLMRKYGV